MRKKCCICRAAGDFVSSPKIYSKSFVVLKNFFLALRLNNFETKWLFKVWINAYCSLAFRFPDMSAKSSTLNTCAYPKVWWIFSWFWILWFSGTSNQVESTKRSKNIMVLKVHYYSEVEPLKFCVQTVRNGYACKITSIDISLPLDRYQKSKHVPNCLRKILPVNKAGIGRNAPKLYGVWKVVSIF